MAGEALDVKNIAEVRRLWTLGFTNREISKITDVHRNTVNKYVARFKSEIEALRNPTPPSVLAAVNINTPELSEEFKAVIDWEKIRLDVLSGVPLTVIHEELLETNQTKIQYPGFWKQAQKKISLTNATMVRIFRPGERCEIDYADGIDILDPATGEVRSTEFFVGVLCHSRYAFAEFTFSQKSSDFLESHVNMFDYFGGVTQVVSPDNLKSAVTKAHRYDPVINQAYTRLADYYGIAVVPARVRTPQDKAIVERTIQIFQRYFFMKVRNRTFTSLTELNKVCAEYLVIFNNKKHRIFRRTRLEMYQDEIASLAALPVDRYKVATHSTSKLGRDCHLIFDDNFYSAPHTLRGRELDIWAQGKLIELYHEGSRVAVHARSVSSRKFVTENSHYPPGHEAYADEDVQKIIERAVKVGPHTESLVKSLLETPYPLKHYRRCQGMVALAWKYSSQLLEEAAEMANRFNNKNVQYLERVIKTRKGVKVKLDNEIKSRAANPFLRGISNIH